MRTKIIATIGPKSESAAMLSKLIGAGMDIARMNFSHCMYAEYRKRATLIRRIAKKQRRRVSILQDLRGPRIRVGVLPKSGRVLTEGETVVFTTDEKPRSAGVKGAIHIDDPYLHQDMRAGEPIYLTNGIMELVVQKVSGTLITARVIRGGTLYSHKAVNVPATNLTTSGLTEKDIEDVRFAMREGVDYIALSFVQSAKDVERLRAVVKGKAAIIAKIERAVALKNIDAIIQAADGIMVARGDLGTELPVEKVPYVQKNLIRHAMWHSKPAIAATQMLSSMIDHPHPTRAEVSDIANAVWDGADAVMLSDETAAGAYPIEALETMAKVVREAERVRFERPNLLR
jgi:pyruvate kinase